MRSVRVLGVTVMALAFQGCAAWQDHNKKTFDARMAFQAGHFEQSLAAMEPEKENKLDGLCFQLDSGVVAQVGGDFNRSNKEFESAEATIQGFEDRGLNGSVIAEEIGSIAVNEKTIPYQGEDFEKVLVPVFRSRNYLLEGKTEDAMIEVRRIWLQQDIVKQLHDKELKESNEEADKRRVDRSKLGEIEGKVEYPQGALKSPESVYEITYAHYLSGLISEKHGKIDDAFISMQAASKIRPDAGFVALDVMRLARMRGSSDIYDSFKKSNPNLELPGKDDGSVALLFDCGWAPHKRELKIPLPSFSTFGAIAIPLYDRTPNPAAFARLVLNDRVYSTAVLSDVEAIAFKYHKNGLATRVLKQILRATIKIAAGEAAAAGVREVGRHNDNRAAGNLGGLAAGLTVGVYNYVSEQADLRAWLTLPQTFQAVRAWAPPGTYEARVELCDAGGHVLNTANLGTVTIRPRSLQFVTARSLDRSLFAAIHKDAGAPLPMGPAIPTKVETPPPPRKVETPPPPRKVETPPPPKVEEPKARACPGCGRSILDKSVRECPDCATPLDGSKKPEKAPDPPMPEEGRLPPKVEEPKPEEPKPETPKPAARACSGCGDTVLDANAKECPGCGTPFKKD